MEPLIFISYTSADQSRVRKYYDYLSSKNLNVWIDYKKLKAGQNWDFEIRRALSRASIIIVFISNNSITKRGYVQREIKLALNKYEEKLSDDIYVVPVVLDDDATVPEILMDVQFVRESKGNCEVEIEESIKYQLNQLGVEVESSKELSSVSWSISNYKDLWDGLPGYELDIGFLSFSSDEYSRLSDISDCIKGELLGLAMEMRNSKFEIDLERFNYGQLRQARASTLDAHCGEPTIVGKMIFINYAIHTYFSGAAHPNMYFRTFCFMLDPVIRISSLSDFFLNPDEVFPIIQEKLRNVVLQNLLEQLEVSEEDRAEEAERLNFFIHEGTSNWSDFNSFIMKGEKLEILFSPYQVACYADGPQIAELELVDLIQFIKHHFLCALDMEFVKYRQDWTEQAKQEKLAEATIPLPPS